MSRDALLAALERDAHQLLAEARERSAAQLAALHREEAERLQLLRENEEGRRQALAATARRALLAQALRQALAERLTGEARLQQRLLQLAQQLLAELAAPGEATLLAALAQELPEAEWQQITVNPREETAARQLFPQADIRSTTAVSGGLRCETAGGRIVVDNTLEKRLALAWPELLPALLRDLEVSGAAAPD